MKNKVLLLAALLALGVTSCGGNKPVEPSSEQGDESQIVTPSSDEQGQTSNIEEPSSTPVTPSSQQVTTSSEATQPSSEAPASSQPAESSLPPEEQPQDYQLCTILGFENGGEAIKGKLVYWHGDGGHIDISEGTGEDRQYLILDYTAGWQWYSGQVFLATPYAEAGDVLSVEFDVVPSVAGTITVNGNLFTLEANKTNHIKYKVTVGVNLRAIDLQFGVYEGNVIYPNCKFKFTEPLIRPFNGTYHKATFGVVIGDSAIQAMSYYVKHGQKLFFVPDYSDFEATLGQNKVVKGWKDNAGNYATTNSVINDDTQYILEIVDKDSLEKRILTYKLGNETIHTEEVYDGLPANTPTFAWYEIGFGHSAVGYYDDQGLTQAHNFAAPVTGNQTIYVKREMSPSTYVDWGWAPDATFVAEEDKYTASNLNCGLAPGNETWRVQINFMNVPSAAGVTYVLSFKYKLTVAQEGAGAGNCQVWDGGTTQGFGVCALTPDGAEHEVFKEYNGDDSAIDSFEKLTFELGQCGNGASIEISELNITMSKNA